MIKQILIVDDDENSRIRLNRLFTDNGYNVTTAESAETALKALEKQFYQVIISDHRMPGMSGVEFFEQVKANYPSTVRIVYSEYEDFMDIATAFNKGSIYRFLPKKLRHSELLQNVNSAFHYFEERINHQSTPNNLDKTIEAIVITNRTGEILSINEAFQKLTEYNEPDVLGEKLNIFDCSTQILADIQTRIKEKNAWEGKLQVVKKNGEHIPIFLSISAIKNHFGLLEQIVYYFIDISDKESFKEKLNHEVNHDKLTGLLNRKYFGEKIKQLMDTCNKEKNLVVISIDIERFQNINAILGHETGDDVLNRTSQIIVKSIEEYKGVVARIGDDQFGIAICINQNGGQEKNIINTIVNAFKKPIDIDGKEIYISVNCGTSCYPEDGNDAVVLIQKAVLATGYAKTIGKENFISYQPFIDNQLNSKKILISDIRKAIEEDEFVFYYQPKLDLASKKICGAEALLRWQHPTHGLILPKDFIAICEETYLIVDIERKMLYKGCEFLKTLNDSLNLNISISFNISPQEFKCANIPLLLTDILEKTQAPSNLVEIEITETNLLNNLYEIKEHLEKIKKLGIKISLDDFGKGYSSLNYLTTLTFDIVKIDRDFIKNIEQEPIKKVILPSMLDLCDKIGLKTVIEGVETQAEFDHICKLPCNILQGFYISKPISEQNFISFVKNYKFTE